MKRWILALVTVISLISGVGATFAQGLGHGGLSYGGYGYGGGVHGYGGGGYGGQQIRDVGNYDYHAGGSQRRGFHRDYVPGHYDYHRQNHAGW